MNDLQVTTIHTSLGLPAQSLASSDESVEHLDICNLVRWFTAAASLRVYTITKTYQPAERLPFIMDMVYLLRLASSASVNMLLLIARTRRLAAFESAGLC